MSAASLISGVNVVFVVFCFWAQVCRDQSSFISLTLLTLFLCSILVVFLMVLSFSCLAICNVMWLSSVKCLLKCLHACHSTLIACVHFSIHPGLDRGLSLAIGVESSTALVRVLIILTVTVSIWSSGRTKGTSGRSWSTLWKISLFIFLKRRLVGSSSCSSWYPNTVSIGRWSEPLSSSLLTPVWQVVIY